MFRRSIVILFVLAFTFAGCAGVRDQVAGRSLEPGGFAADELVDVLSPGTVPAVDRPSFETIGTASERLVERDPVAVLEMGGDARAYPLAILVWHEIINDVVGGDAVAVTFSPLTGSAVAFRRTVDGRVPSFAGSGKLHRANLVMYDRSAGRPSLWPQLPGGAVLGPAAGHTLETIPLRVVSFDDFARTFPAGKVLTARTGTARVYGATPYAGYDSRSRPSAAFFPHAPDPRIGAMERVLGVRAGDDSRAYPFGRLGSGVVADRIGGRDVVVLWRAGRASALDSALISDGSDTGAAAAYVPDAGGRHLDLEAVAGGFRDRQTGSIWSVLGVATAGPLAGSHLEPLPQVEAFWFAWAASVPRTTIYGRS